MDEIQITLTGQGLSYRKGDLSLMQASKIMGFLATPEISSETTANSEEHANSETISIGEEPTAVLRSGSQFEAPAEAILKLSAKTIPQKIVAIALYLGATPTNGKICLIEDVKAEFAKAGEATPQNIIRDLRAAVSAGYVYPESKNSFRLLKPVEEIIKEGCFPKKNHQSSRKQKPTDPTDREIQDVVKNLPICTSMRGYPDFLDVKTGADQILWLIKYAKENQVSSVSRYDICHLSQHLGGSIDSRTFTAANKRNIASSYIVCQKDQLMITPRGEQYLEECKANER